MPRQKTLKKRTSSKKSTSKGKTQSFGTRARKRVKKMPLEDLLDILIECLKENDPDSFKEALEAYLLVHNKSKIARMAGISRDTLYEIVSPCGNPTLSMLAKIINATGKAA